MSAGSLLVSLTCSSTQQPQVGRFVADGDVWALVGVSRQRPGTSLPANNPGAPSHGSFTTDSEYAGCPSCGAGGFVRCARCARLACWQDSWEIFHCPSCGASGRVSGYIETLDALSTG